MILEPKISLLHCLLKKKSLFGFIKSHKSWHSVEKININENFIRKSININLLLV